MTPYPVKEDNVLDLGERSCTRPRLTAVTGLRIGWGTALVAAPRPLLRVLAHTDAPADRVAVAVLRVLGVRHVGQAVVEMLGPQPVVRYLGAAVDGLHALTAVGLAVLDPRWRRGALTDTAIAAFFAATTAVSATRTGSHR